MKIFFKLAQWLFLVFMLLKYWQYKCQFMGLIAYMIEHKLKMPDRKQMKKYVIYAGKNLLGVKH